jgi:tetratricopeptide (TPR) repeat protein
MLSSVVQSHEGDVALAAPVTDEELLARIPSDISDAALQLRLGIALQALGCDRRALQPLLRATVLAPTDPNAWLQTSIALSIVGRGDEAEHAVAALRELKPSRSKMWFDAEDDEALQPVARLSRATYLGLVAGEVDQAEQDLAKLVRDYASIALPRVQHAVALAEVSLAQFRAGRGETIEALRTLASVIARLETSADPRTRVCVANALLWRGALLAETDDIHEALAAWERVRSAYGDDDDAQLLVAQALANMAGAYEQMTLPGERDRILAEIARRYAHSHEPELRRCAVVALLASDRKPDVTDGQTSHGTSLDRVADGFRYDPDPVIARISAEVRMDRWMHDHQRLNAGLHGRALRAVLRVLVALRHRRPHGIVYPQRTSSRPRRVLTALLVGIGRSTQIAGVVAFVILSIHASAEGDTTSLQVLGCGVLVTAGGLAALLGARIAGRFTVDTLALAPSRLPRTAFSLVLALGAAWVSPTIERVGISFIFGPIGATYDWFSQIGLPIWVRIPVIIPLAPIEVLVMIALAQLIIVGPARAVFGRQNALVAALEDSFGSVEVGRE